jgi:phosphate transport system substrate-binding protein
MIRPRPAKGITPMSQVIRALVAGIALTALTGCGGGPSGQSEIVTLPGTGDSQDVLRELARAYLEQYPDRRVVVPDSIGSEGGIRVVGTGESPIGRVARPPSDSEKAEYGDFKYVEFARVHVTFVVSPTAGVTRLSAQQICDIFAGQTTNWKEVGGHDLPVAVQARPEGSNMLTIRKHLACFTQLKVTARAQFNLRNIDLVESMKTVPGAIGFMPLSEARLHGYQVVTLDGVEPGTPQYPLDIGLGFVFKKPLPPSFQQFVDYLRTERAREVMQKTGHLPVQG